MCHIIMWNICGNRKGEFGSISVDFILFSFGAQGTKNMCLNNCGNS